MYSGGIKMTVGTREHYELLQGFESSFKGNRFDKEDKRLWAIGQIYQDGITNNLYKAFIAGYSLGRVNYLNQ